MISSQYIAFPVAAGRKAPPYEVTETIRAAGYASAPRRTTSPHTPKIMKSFFVSARSLSDRQNDLFAVPAVFRGYGIIRPALCRDFSFFFIEIETAVFSGDVINRVFANDLSRFGLPLAVRAFHGFSSSFRRGSRVVVFAEKVHCPAELVKIHERSDEDQ